MNDDKDQLDELPDSLRGIVAGIVAERAPDDLKESVRSSLDERFKPRPRDARAKKYAAAAVAMSMIAAIVAAVVFRLPSSTDPNELNVGSGESITTVAREDDARIRRPSVEGPSLWAYHRAANGSLDQLDGLLAKHAASVLTSGHSNARSTDLYTTSRFLEE